MTEDVPGRRTQKVPPDVRDILARIDGMREYAAIKEEVTACFLHDAACLLEGIDQTRCAACGNDDLEVTTQGAITGGDPNVYRCLACGHSGPVRL